VGERVGTSPKPLDPHSPISYSTFFDAIKDHVRKVAQDLRLRGDTARAARIEQASAHWLRHTFATEALAAGADRGVVQENLGHASAAMLSVYSSVAEQRRLQAMSSFWKSRSTKEPAGSV
jgi:site-specific recombinase XerD